MTNLTTELYFTLNSDLKSFLQQIDSFFAITTDGWSSKKKKKAFISLTIHYLNSQFSVENISLGILKADYEHNSKKLSEHLNKLLEEYGILNKVSIMVVDHASVMGSTCAEMKREFYGCFAHFLNLVCKLFFDSIKKKDFDISISPDENNSDVEEDQTTQLEQVKKSLQIEIDAGEAQCTFLGTIEEETEEQIAFENFDFNLDEFSNLAMKINLVIKKIKKVVTTFNGSNNLSRDLLKEQKENAFSLLIDLTEENKSYKKKCVLQLFQDVVTR